MQTNRMSSAAVVTLACWLALGCSVNHDGKNSDDAKNVEIKSPLGGLKVRTTDVKAEDTGMKVYPNAKQLPSTHKDDKNQANVNIDTPWFGLKVVALKFESADPQQKIWDFYKKEMSQYGRVLECKPGSPDQEARAKTKDELTCNDGDRKKRRNVHAGDGDELKVGTENKQRIIALKPRGEGTEITMVFVSVREDRESQ